ncbi:Sec1/Munc18 related protein [Novymonas esmeraldas]|uniref:Sec1/Munc18 related protein n=1 Tax=Novymonas esmeraldas TaxID=1808958 RepID=A0AAW0EL16_9TRYP
MLRGSPSRMGESRRNSTSATVMPSGDFSPASSSSGYPGGVTSATTTATGGGGGGAGRSPIGKKPAITRNGLLGCVKQRIFADMLDPVAGEHNIMICDNKGAEILSTCIRMHDLMDHGVTLVEDLGMPRQPVLSSAAIYLIEPTEESVRRVMYDWQVKNTYREAHVFFTSPSSERLIQLMASEPRLVEAIKTLKDMLLDFAVPESLVFNLRMYGDIQKLFPPDVALSGGRENILGQVATRLVSVFFTIGAGVPTVQYQGSSRLAQQVARIFADQAAQASRTNPATFRMSSAATGTMDESPLLILVDRSFDAVEPLVHERTYQCLLNDLMPLENNVYQQTFEGRSGQEGTRSCPIDEQDPYWCQYRHKFFPVCLVELPKKLQDLMAANPALVAGMSKLNSAGGGTGNRLSDVGSAIRALPEFQERQAKLSVHIDICTKIMDRYKQQKLTEVCEVEQDIAAGRRPFKELYDSVHRMTADVSLPIGVRVRLVMLLIAGTNTREFSDAKRLMLLQEAGLSNEIDRCNALAMFISRLGQLPQDAAAHGTNGEAGNGRGGGSGGGNGGDKGPIGSLMRRSLRSKAAVRQDSNSTISGSANNRDGGNEGGPTSDPYRNQAYLILNAAVNNSLSTSDFPVFNTGADGALGGGGGRGGSLGGALQQRRTGRGAGNAGNGGGGGGGAAVVFGSAVGGEGNIMLDLGHEGQFALKSRRRVVLFVLGGVTYGEVRAAYDVSQSAHVEAFVGGTSLLTPEIFLSTLSSLR